MQSRAEGERSPPTYRLYRGGPPPPLRERARANRLRKQDFARQKNLACRAKKVILVRRACETGLLPRQVKPVPRRGIYFETSRFPSPAAPSIGELSALLLKEEESRCLLWLCSHGGKRGGEEVSPSFPPSLCALAHSHDPIRIYFVLRSFVCTERRRCLLPPSFHPRRRCNVSPRPDSEKIGEEKKENTPEHGRSMRGAERE